MAVRVVSELVLSYMISSQTSRAGVRSRFWKFERTGFDITIQVVAAAAAEQELLELKLLAPCSSWRGGWCGGCEGRGVFTSRWEGL